jgi:hypothetical protein
MIRWGYRHRRTNEPGGPSILLEYPGIRATPGARAGLNCIGQVQLEVPKERASAQRVDFARRVRPAFDGPIAAGRERGRARQQPEQAPAPQARAQRRGRGGGDGRSRAKDALAACAQVDVENDLGSAVEVVPAPARRNSQVYERVRRMEGTTLDLKQASPRHCWTGNACKASSRTPTLERDPRRSHGERTGCLAKEGARWSKPNVTCGVPKWECLSGSA